MKPIFKIVLIAAAVALTAVGGPARAEYGVTVTGQAAWFGRYLWRGMPINEQAVLQPSVTLAGRGFRLNGWGNFDLTDWGENAGYGDQSGRATEVDYTGAWEHDFGPGTLTAGFVNYTFPQTGLSPTTEVFAGLGFEVLLSPTLTVYVDEVAEGANYLSLDLGHSFELGSAGPVAAALAVSAHAGWANAKFVRTYYASLDQAAFHDWSVGVSLPVVLGGGFAVAPSYQYSSLGDAGLREEVADNWDRDPAAGVLGVSLSFSGEILPAEE